MILNRWLKAYQNMDLRRRGQWLLASSLLLGCLTAWVVVEQVSAARQALGQFETVLVAAREIPSQTLIDRSMLESRPMPARYLLPGMLPKGMADQVEGAVTVVPIQAGSPIIRSMLRESSAQDPDKRTYTLAASRQVVFAGLRQGDRVDVLAVFEHEKQGGTNFIIRDVEIVAAWENARVAHVTLSLTPDDAMLLAYYENFGRQLRLLRQG